MSHYLRNFAPSLSFLLTTMQEMSRYIWAVISPSAPDSVAYMESAFATSAAVSLRRREYLALVFEPSLSFDTLLTRGQYAVAYLVQSASHYPLPDTYLPIAPCRLGTREPLVPGFDWPFGECVVNTGRFYSFDPVFLGSTGGNPPRILPDDGARFFSPIAGHDGVEQMRMERRNRLACKKVELGVNELLEDDFQWTTFSRKSTDVAPTRGAPKSISVHVHYEIESLGNVLPADEFFEDVREVKRLKARFSWPATERTIRWQMDQAVFGHQNYRVLDEAISEVLPALIELSATFERPESPGEAQGPLLTNREIYALGEPTEEELWGVGCAAPLPDQTVFPAASLDSRGLQVVYFDIYGTLIDNETGIFEALEPLLAQCPHRFTRREALTFYFESEIEVKKRLPTSPYSEVLALSHEDMAMRLGLSSSTTQSSAFAASIFDWPLFDDAIQSLQALRPWIPAIVAVVDIDQETLCKTSSFPPLIPYFAGIYSWDASRTYRPDFEAFLPSVKYHDDMGVPRAQRCLVSNSVFRDLEPASELEIPTIWLRYPTSMGGGLSSEECYSVWRVCTDLPGLVTLLTREKDALGDPAWTTG
ncbi:HAD-like domain-containing protein [Mycena maculata]|uniref:HAD-like domain-containing protein n=1 Tax=Mycena maculata TaxID=230809 RepID=A0AAD7HKS8_9AGAR|nr:HAD-like domain-containing protein [Mycena maculata]